MKVLPPFCANFLFILILSFFHSKAASQADTIVIRGKFLAGCSAPKSVKIAFQNVDNTWWKDVAVNNGEFTYKHFLTEPRRAAIRTVFGNKLDFFVTPQEKVYQIEISCNGSAESFDVKNSAENAAYIPFSKANKQHQENLDSLSKNDLSSKEGFSLLKKTILDYQKNLATIAAANSNTFTAKMFIASEQFPDSWLTSREELQKNFLNRKQFGEPFFYNDFLPQRILINYIAIRGKNSNPDEAVQTLMTMTAGNTNAAKKLQENMSNIFFNMHQEDLYLALIKWAEQNPDKMLNVSVKNKLASMKKVMAGSILTDFSLPDTTGKQRALGETVAASKLTLLIFYGPTCGHCKKKVPTLIPLWEKYKNKGLKVYAVASDSKDDEWRKFIKEHADDEWVHVFKSESSNPADVYQASNPSFILIDNNGTILSRIGDLDFVTKEIETRFK